VTTSESSQPARRPTPATRGMSVRQEPLPWLKPGIFLGSLVPLAWIVVRASLNQLPTNPIAVVQNETGLAALVLLLASLACTPAKKLFGWTWQMRIRRELGLFAFFYACLHFAVYLILDQFFDVNAIVADVVKRPFITVGVVALILMVPVAITSTNAWVRRLGYQRWYRLHQLVYLAGILGVIHFIWRVKIDVTQPLTYAAVLAALLGLRLIFWLYKRNTPRPRPR